MEEPRHVFAMSSPQAASPQPYSAERCEQGRFDLHMHSTFSDGSDSVDELLRAGRAAGLAGIAVTDHDCLRQLSAVRARARALGYPALAGVEVSARNPRSGRKVHVLGFSLEATPGETGPLERLVGHTLRARTANSLWQAWLLGRSGVEGGGRALSLDAVCDVARHSTGVYKQHVMEALTHRPYVDPGYQATYARTLRGGAAASRDIDYPAAVDVVRAIREQGGVAVLAHPGQMNSWGIVGELVEAGLQGIEAFHPDHTREDERHALGVAADRGLFVTGGSDYHGRYGRPERVGYRFVTLEEAGPRVAELFVREEELA